MKFNALEKVVGISISILFVTVFSPYYVNAEAKITVDQLILELKHAEPYVRKNAARALIPVDDPRVVEPLVASLKDNDSEVRDEALKALRAKVTKDPRVVELLGAELRDNNSKVRKDIAQMFQYIEDPRVVEPLIAALKDSDAKVRYSASNSLATKSDPRAVEPLILALKDNDSGVRQHASSGLDFKNDPRVVEPLIAALKDSDAEVRRIAGAVLGNIEDPRAFVPLVALLQDGNSVVREWVSEKLIRIEDPRVLEPLIAALKDDEPMMRQNAASILEKKKEDPRVIEPLIAAMKDSDPTVRQSAAYTLAYMKDPRAADLLIDALKDNDTEVVRLSLLALLVKEREDPRVAAAMKDLAPSVRKLTSNSLEKKGTGYQCLVTGMELVFVKGGCYQMGYAFGNGYSHEVCIDSFHIGKYEVTQGQWEKVMGNNPSHFSNTSYHNPGENCKNISDNCPVENVSWQNVQEFIRKLNFLSGKNYRLPTEAEWEYAARSGGKKERWSGTSQESSLGNYAWIGINSGGETHPVGKRKPNRLGIYDMTGNVAEWCSDWYGDDYYRQSPRKNPKGPKTGSIDEEDGGLPRRVVRGGHWNNGMAEQSRTTSREGGPYEENDTVGFRMVLSTP